MAQELAIEMIKRLEVKRQGERETQSHTYKTKREKDLGKDRKIDLR